MICLLILIIEFVLITNAKLYCPRYHYEIDSSCYLFYLENRTLNYSINFCSNFSNSLISLETDSKWNNFTNHLDKNFNLTKFKFKVNSNHTECSVLTHKNGTWCLQKENCRKETGFICEWKPSKMTKQLNKRLETLLENVFFYFNLFAVICLSFLSLFFIQFYFYQTSYLKSYVDKMDEISSNADTDLIYFKKLI